MRVPIERETSKAQIDAATYPILVNEGAICVCKKVSDDGVKKKQRNIKHNRMTKTKMKPALETHQNLDFFR